MNVRTGVGFKDEVDAHLVKEVNVCDDRVFDKNMSANWIHRCDIPNHLNEFGRQCSSSDNSAGLASPP